MCDVIWGRGGRGSEGGGGPWGWGVGGELCGGEGRNGGGWGETAETHRTTQKILSFYKILLGFVSLVLLSRMAGESEVVYRR